MDAGDRELLRGSLRALLARPGADVLAGLAELGWAEVVADDPAEATTLLFTEHGRAPAAAALLDHVVLGALGPPATAVLHPVTASGEGEGEGVLLTDPRSGEVVVPGPDGVTLVPAASLRVGEMGGFHPGSAARWARVTDPGAGRALDADWAGALALGRRALAAELIGVGEAVLDTAVEHTSSRVQYGRHIAGYQSVRHRLAEARASLTGASAVLRSAWADGSPWAAAAAKAQAGSACLEVSRHAMQVCGAVGLTSEHHLHRLVGRGAVLDAVLGRARDLEAWLGRRLLDGFAPPPVVTL